MKGFLISSTIFLLSVFDVDAFLPLATFPTRNRLLARTSSGTLHPTSAPFIIIAHGNQQKNALEATSSEEDTELPHNSFLTHEDILWKLRPPKGTGILRRFALRAAANLIRLDCKVRRVDPPFLLCPKTRQAVLEAHYRAPGKRRLQKIARFGITTQRGPPAPPIVESVKDLYGVDFQNIGTAAIIYMFVEPEYRSMGVGEMALEVISTIHAIQGCDFTVLVVDDNGSGKLVDWYTRHGFTKAPKLQDLLGSPNGKYGLTMMAPTNSTLSSSCQIQWW